jgi:hypothetical protein
VIGIGSYADLLSHSATVEEVHELAGWAARVLVVVRDAGGLLPPVLSGLVEEIEARPSVARRLNEMNE